MLPLTRARSASGPSTWPPDETDGQMAAEDRGRPEPLNEKIMDETEIRIPPECQPGAAALTLPLDAPPSS